MAICINPKVYFSGDNVDDVQGLYAMFSMIQIKNNCIMGNKTMISQYIIYLGKYQTNIDKLF